MFETWLLSTRSTILKSQKALLVLCIDARHALLRQCSCARESIMAQQDSIRFGARWCRSGCAPIWRTNKETGALAYISGEVECLPQGGIGWVPEVGGLAVWSLSAASVGSRWGASLARPSSITPSPVSRLRPCRDSRRKRPSRSRMVERGERCVRV